LFAACKSSANDTSNYNDNQQQVIDYAPGPVMNLTATATTDTMTVTWEKPVTAPYTSNTVGYDITVNQVIPAMAPDPYNKITIIRDIYIAGTGEDSMLTEASGTLTLDDNGLKFVVVNLIDGTQYEITVCAVNAKGDGEPTTITATTDKIPVADNIPGPVVNLSAAASVDTITITWEAPSDPNVSTILGYGVLIKQKLPDNAVVVNDIYTGNANENGIYTYVASNLKPDTEYEITICAVATKGNGDNTIITTTTSAVNP